MKLTIEEARRRVVDLEAQIATTTHHVKWELEELRDYYQRIVDGDPQTIKCQEDIEEDE